MFVLGAAKRITAFYHGCGKVEYMTNTNDTERDWETFEFNHLQGIHGDVRDEIKTFIKSREALVREATIQGAINKVEGMKIHEEIGIKCDFCGVNGDETHNAAIDAVLQALKQKEDTEILI